MQPGELLTSAETLLERLREYDEAGELGPTYSRTTLFKCLDKLVKRGYITYQSKPGYGLRIRILDWSKMQGKKPKGYNYFRGEYPPPSNCNTGLVAD